MCKKGLEKLFLLIQLLELEKNITLYSFIIYLN